MCSKPAPQRVPRIHRDDSVSSNTSSSSNTSTSSQNSDSPLLKMAPIEDPQERNRPQRHNKCILTLAIVSVIFSLASAGVITLQYFGLVPSASSRQSVCIPCQAIVTTPYPEKDETIRGLDVKIENRTLLCCASTPTQYNVLFSKLAERKIKEKDVIAAVKADASQPTIQTKASARIGAHLLAGTESTNSEPSYQLRGWMTKGSQAYKEGLHLADDKLIVQHGGLYLVYSQVYFMVKLDEIQTLPDEEPLIGHEVHRYSLMRPGGKDTLLQSAQTYGKHEQNKNLFFHTSHVSGVFKLSPREEIYVTVSHPQYIYRDPARSFFGVFKLN